MNLLTFSGFTAAYRSRKTVPSEVLSRLLDEIAASPLNAFISVDRADVLSQAKAADARWRGERTPGPLCGIPVAVKDLIDVAGMRTTMGSEQYANNVAAQDAAVVRRLRVAGAIIVGKTNTHEFAFGSTGDRSFFGAVCNPHDPAHITGGSSSGSAAALGAGLCAGGLGTDTSASIRLPAALCGVVGLKPTFDLLSRAGIFNLSRTLDHVGPMTTTVRDNALMLNVLAGNRRKDYARLIGLPLEGFVVGVPCGFYTDYLGEEVRVCLGRARKAFEAAGARVVDVNISDIQTIYEAQQHIVNAEAYFEHRKAVEAGAPFQEEVLERLKRGAQIPASDYIEALRVRPVARRVFDLVFRDVDILLAATCGITAPSIDERSTVLNGKTYPTPWLLTRLTAPANLSGHPALSVPFGVDRHELPVGMQLIGPWGGEARLFQFGAVLEEL
jgi:aspartyl-tRNA(Asn)/glutamyl-tRNA(Gln) amidotransferase subunit A